MDSRDYRILKHFITENFMKLNELAYLEDVSQKSMQKYIDNLNQSLKRVAEIKKKEDVYYLKIYNFSAFSKIQSGYLKEELDYNDLNKRKSCIIKMLIETKYDIYLEDLMSLLMISRSTLIRDLNSLKQDLKKFQITIKISQVTGIELIIKQTYQLALAINYLVYDYYYSDFLLSSNLLVKIEKNCRKNFVNHKDEELFCRILGIVLFLKRNGYEIKEIHQDYINRLDDKCFVYELFDEIEQQFQISLSDTEKNFLCFPFNLRKTMLYHEKSNERALYRLGQIAIPIIEEISFKFNVKMNSEEFYGQIKNHLLDLITRSIFMVETTDLFNNKILESFPISAEMAILLKKRLEEYHEIKIENNEVNYLTLYYQQFLKDKVETMFQEKWIILFCGTISLSIKNYIISQINEDLGENIEFISIGDIKEYQGSFNRVIFIFSDTVIDSQKITPPIIPVKNIIRTSKIDVYIKMSILEKMIRDCLCHFRITNLKAKNYIDAVYKLISIEEQNNVLGESFTKNWLEKEKHGNLLLENEVAIPHVVDDSIDNKIVLSIGILEDPVFHDQKGIKVIMLIGIPKKLSYETTQALNEVYDLSLSVAQNPFILNKLLNYNSKKSILQLIEGL